MTQRSDETGRRWHDMGGTRLAEAGPAPGPEHDYALWEKRVDALMTLSSKAGFFTVDGLRRALEDMGPEAFETMSYYERWMAAVTQNLVAQGAFTLDELNAKMAEEAARGSTYGAAQEPP
ncbi:MAG: ScnB-like protein [Pikeienuella sp.]